MIKYPVLDTFLPDTVGSRDPIILHIDADAIIYRLFRKKDLSLIYSVSKDTAVKDVVVGMVNVIGHYRRYIITKLRRNCIIYLYYNTMTPPYQEAMYPGYRASWYRLFNQLHPEYGVVTEIMNKAIPFVASILQYTTGNYMIDNQGVDNPTAINYFIRKIERTARSDRRWSDALHIIFSRSVVPLQLLNDNTIQLYPKRDKSYIITANTAYSKGIMEGKKSQASDLLRPPSIPYVIMLGGLKDLDMKHTPYARGLTRAAVLISRAIRHDREQYLPDLVLDRLTPLVNDPKRFVQDREQMKYRYNAVALSKSMYAITKSIMIRMESSIVDLYDQNALEEINNLLSQIDADENLIEITSLNLSRT